MSKAVGKQGLHAAFLSFDCAATSTSPCSLLPLYILQTPAARSAASQNTLSIVRLQPWRKHAQAVHRPKPAGRHHQPSPKQQVLRQLPEHLQGEQCLQQRLRRQQMIACRLGELLRRLHLLRPRHRPKRLLQPKRRQRRLHQPRRRPPRQRRKDSTHRPSHLLPKRVLKK